MRKVEEVEPLPDFRIRVRFDNGLVGIADLRDDLWGEIGEPLKDPAYFAQVFIDNGAVTWPNGFDCCPDALYSEVSGG